MEEELDFNKPTFESKHRYGDGVQKVWRFDNNYGASVVQLKIGNIYGSYSDNDQEWELAVIKFKSEEPFDFEIVYNTYLTNDVIGHLSEDEVIDLLKKIKKLQRNEGDLDEIERKKKRKKITTEQLRKLDLEKKKFLDVAENDSIIEQNVNEEKHD